MTRFSLFCMVAATVLLVAGCGKKAGQPGGLGDKTGTVAGVKWGVPARWTVLPDRPMRVATYGIPAAEGDTEGGECAASFFGSGMGGDVESNIARWVGQFENASEPVRATKQVNGINVTTVKVSGDYLSPGGPMMQSTGSKKGYQLIGAIIDGPEGVVFFKLTGPRKSAANAETEFDAMVGSLSK
jgi:hypothetical protein